MFKSTVFTIAALSVLALAAGCTSGGFSYPPGNQCVDGYNPVNFGPDGKLKAPDSSSQQKLIFSSATPPTPQSFPAGTYKYVSTDILFVAAPGSTPDGKPLMIQTTNALRSSDNQFHTGVVCVRNMTLKEPDLVVEGNTVSNMTVGKDGKIMVTPRHVMLTFINNTVSICKSNQQDVTGCEPKDGTPVEGLPTDVLKSSDANAVVIDSLMLQNPNNDYELRAHYLAKHLDGTPYGDYYITTHMTFTAAP